MAGMIRNLEVLSAGNWSASTGQITVTEKHLDDMVEAFQGLINSNIVKPHLKLGHSDSQKWFGQKDGIPTLGWISNLWRSGSKLFADIVDVPEALLELIKQGRYHNVSSEFYLDRSTPVEFNGKKYFNFLSAVALLGIEMPAAKDLAGIAQALFTSNPPKLQEGGNLTIVERDIMPDNIKAMFSQEQVDALIQASVNKATAEFTTKHEKTVSDLRSELEVATKAKEAAEDALVQTKTRMANLEIDSMLDAAIKEGKMLPKQREFAKSILVASANSVVKAADGSEKTAKQLFNDFINASGKQVTIGEVGVDNKVDGDFQSPADEVDKKAKALMSKDDKIGYHDAMKKVLANDADLRNRYATIQS